MEWNQPFSKEHIRIRNGVKLVGEIIQLGAVKLDENQKITDKFEIKIAPRQYTVLQYMVKKVTGLTQSELKHGAKFSEAVSKFRQWCGDGCVFLTWGPNDIPMLRDNLRFFGLSTSWIPQWFNAQCFFNQQTENKGRQYSIDFAMEYFGILADKERHDALNDAYYTGKILEKLDIQRGMAEYDDHALYMNNVVIEESRGSGKTRFDGYESKNDAITDKRVMRTRCMDCHKFLATIKPVTYGSSRIISLGKCQAHGDFIIECRIKSGTDKKYCIIKTVKRISPREKNDWLIKMSKWHKTKLLLTRKARQKKSEVTEL
ncbi:MAG: exonuclease domain-containing protein [Clostridia bacterium]|nr:exonuclease domain-containing protein [Clostridia bacterium]